MSQPVLVSLALSLQAAVQAISVSTGYFYTVKPTSAVLKPVNLATLSPTEVPYVVLGHRVEPVARDFATSRPVAIQDRWRFTIEGRIDAPSPDQDVKLLTFAQFTADLERALVIDPQRGRLALYTYVGQPTPYFGLDNQAMLFFEQPVEILLQRPYGAP